MSLTNYKNVTVISCFFEHSGSMLIKKEFLTSLKHSKFILLNPFLKTEKAIHVFNF